MASHKRSAKAKQLSRFKAQLESGEHAGIDDLFENEKRRRGHDDQKREAAFRYKSCERKNRYASYLEAQAAIAACANHGTRGLHCYQCSFCHGWHLTSKPQPSSKPQSSDER